jgi:hypothetical protein
MESGLRDGVILSRLEQIQQATGNDEFEERLLGLLNDVEARPLSFMEKDLLDGLLRAYEAKLRDGDVLLRCGDSNLRAWSASCLLSDCRRLFVCFVLSDRVSAIGQCVARPVALRVLAAGVAAGHLLDGGTGVRSSRRQAR